MAGKKHMAAALLPPPPSLPGKQTLGWSPVGGREYTVPRDQFAQSLDSGDSVLTDAITYPGLDGSTPMTVYPSDMVGDPSIMTHERIHQAQWQMPHQATAQQVETALQPLRIPLVGVPGVTGNAAHEMPAYNFAQYSNKPQAQEAFNNYIDLMYRLNPGQTQKLEVAAPEGFLRDYIREHPRPLAPPTVDMQPIGLMQILRKIVTGR